MKREEAFEILKKYNKDEFHIRHALTVEGVMRYFAKELNEDVEYWGNVGLLHDVDFELYPEEHCKKCIELLNKRTFSLNEMYSFEKFLELKHPNNKNVQAKIRQQLQTLRNYGYLEFINRGEYKLI